MLTLYIADVERDAGMKKLSREEAAKVLEDMKVKIEIPKAAVTQWERNTALDMAIEVLNCSEIQNNSDTISRQAAIYAVAELTSSMSVCISVDECHGMKRMQGMAVRALEGLPAAQPIEERKKGEWTDDNACPFCGFQPWYERDIHTLSYCPNCGADMRGK